MFLPIAYRDLDPSGSDRALATESSVRLGVRPAPHQDPTEPRNCDHLVTEELLDEMGKALAKRLNALVDALSK